MAKRTTAKNAKPESTSMDRDRIAFGGWMRGVREDAGESQSELAAGLKRLGIKLSQGSIAKYEGERIEDPSVEFLQAWSRHYKKDYMAVVLQLVRDKYANVDPGPLRKWSDLDKLKWDLVRAVFVDHRGKIGEVGGLAESDLRAKTRIVEKEQILDMAGLACWEKNFPGLRNCWVIAMQFVDTEDDAFLEAVAHNLRRGVDYSFFIPDDISIGPASQFGLLKAKLIEAGVEDTRVENQLLAVPLDKRMQQMLHDDYAIADPLKGVDAVGFRCVRKPTRYGSSHSYKPRPTYAWRMDPEFLEQIVKTILAFLDDALSDGPVSDSFRNVVRKRHTHIIGR